jgi:hypothetical protein
LHADGEVGSVEQRAAALDGQGLHLVEMRVPAGGADDDAAAEGEDGAHVFNRGLGGGEVDDHVHAGQIGRGERGGVLVLVMSSARTPWPRSRATSATRLPVFPLPRRMSMVNLRAVATSWTAH